ncbi:cytochrome c family protein [Maribius pontilimi]|uniref:Cytochrome c family protein n=1 Tax=Palleronia pontilimi TaxID=1964209 RepID=A0A934IDQ5_9RHOB|nr:cytochrome c family protein [Palleronia pontilimi]MBJ3761307.1 cytochrome c family protein [Palleronia pontilimi]
MFDTMILTKVIGGFCGALLVFLLGAWAAEELYHMGGGHGEEQQAYSIEVPETGGEEEAAEEGPTFMEAFEVADVGAGERVFGKCRACHNLEDGANAVGPHLYGVVGRDVGSVGGYSAYSGALSQVADVWTPENLNGFLEDPRGWATGTSMGFNGLPKVEDRANLIAYLDSVGG